MEDTVARRIGVSTYWMPRRAESLFEALDKAHEAGMRAIEIVPSEWEGPSGFPLPRSGVGFDMDRIDRATLDRLGASCSRFDTVTIHAPARDINSAACNPGIRRESVRQYLKCMELADTIGARWVTFHPGHYTRPALDDRVIVDRNVEFGKRAAELAEKYDLITGLENVGISSGNHFEQLLAAIDGVGSPRFGLNFDIGHVWMLKSPHPYEWLEAFKGRIVELHVHGVFHRLDRGIETHMPLDFDDCYDYPDLFGRIRADGFDGPMIFEILSNSIDQYLDRCRRGKQIVCQAWNGRPEP